MNKDLKKGSSVKSEISPADGKPKLVAGLFAGDKVKYQMNYNGIITHWDALVVDTEPLTLRIKFPDGYVHNAEPDETQWKFISK